MKYRILFSNRSQFACLIIAVFCTICSRDKVSAQSAMRTSSGRLAEDSPIESKPHYLLHLENPEQQALIAKCISKYPYWHKHRMLNKRRIIEIESPYTAKIELYSELELNRLYGKSIAPELSDNDLDYRNIRLQITPNGFKEIIISLPQK